MHLKTKLETFKIEIDLNEVTFTPAFFCRMYSSSQLTSTVLLQNIQSCSLRPYITLVFLLALYTPHAIMPTESLVPQYDPSRGDTALWGAV